MKWAWMVVLVVTSQSLLFSHLGFSLVNRPSRPGPLQIVGGSVFQVTGGPHRGLRLICLWEEILGVSGSLSASFLVLGE